jgi:chitin disaccharide deacetylase
MSRSLVLCADDFGMSAAINRAILDLIERERLSATSCMTTLPDWRVGARDLARLRPPVAIGLHLNLTEGEGMQPLGSAMLAGLLRKFPPGRLEREIDRQLDAFEDAMGAPPDFVDGHQHVQMFPQIRDALAASLARRYPGRPPWVRNARPPLSGHDAPLKALALRGMGTGFGRVLRRFGLKMTRRFAGLYSLRSEVDFQGLMEGWLRGLPNGTLVMCHPGVSGDAVPLAATRAAEAAYLGSDRFWVAAAEHGVRLVPKPDLAG